MKTKMNRKKKKKKKKKNEEKLKGYTNKSYCILFFLWPYRDVDGIILRLLRQCSIGPYSNTNRVTLSCNNLKK